MQTEWTLDDIPSLCGKTAIITRGTSPLGWQTGLELGRAGAEVVLCGSDKAEGTKAIDDIKKRIPGSRVRFEHLDLGNHSDVVNFAEEFNARRDSLDILVNIACCGDLSGIQYTRNGFENNMGVNAVAHFMLTLLLLPSLQHSANPRVTTVVSLAAGLDHPLDFTDYSGMEEWLTTPLVNYTESQLSGLLFAKELDRKCRLANIALTSNAAHPGSAWSDISPLRKQSFIKKVRNWIWTQSPAIGILPILRAATEPEALSGCLYGPNEVFNNTQFPIIVEMPAKALNEEIANTEWNYNEMITDTYWPKIGELENDGNGLIFSHTGSLVWMGNSTFENL